MFKSLYKETEGFRLVSILTPLCMIGEVVMEMIIPKLMSSIIDDGVTAGNLSHIYRIGGWMIVAAAFGLLFGVLGGVFGARASTGYARNLRRSMYRNIQTFSFANIDKYSTAGLVTRMTTDVTNIQNAYQMILRMAIRAPSSMVIAMIMAFTINAKLASIYLVAVIILGGCLVLIMSRASNYFSAAFKKYDDLNESVQENVSAIRVVKAYVREDYESEKFKKASGNVQDLLLRAEKVLSFNSPLMMATVYTCILLISWLGARMIVLSGATSFTTGELMSMLTYCTNILTSLMMLSMVFIMISMSAASAKRVAEVLEEESTLSNGENPVMEVKNGAVRFDHVCFRYKADGRDVLSDINLNIRSGETIGITHGAGVAQDLKTFASYNASPHELVRGMYPQILLDDAGRVAYTSFLEVLLEGDGGAYLWHCSEGKDRAGLGAVIVERALGVPEAYVRADYLATNLFVRNRAEGIVDAISKKLGLMKGLDADIDSLFYAYNDYYDCAMAAVNANYGSFDAYLAEALDFGPEKRQALRAKYLR